MSKRYRVVVALAGGASGFALAVTLVQSANAELLTHKDLTLAVAKTIAETAIADCKAKGYAVSAVVVGRDGETLVAMRGDNASPHTLEKARRGRGGRWFVRIARRR